MAKTTIKVKVFRFNPETDLVPSYKTYEVPWEKANEMQDERGNALQVLKAIYENLDRTLAFPYFSCGYKFCNNCMMTINGVPTHACSFMVGPGDELTIEPMKGYPIIRDIVVDWGRTYVTPQGTYEVSKGTIIKETKAESQNKN